MVLYLFRRRISCINGVSQGGATGSGSLFAGSTPLIISGFPTAVLLADLQIYNTSLPANEAQALYQEGIGGAPINPAYAVGWRQLNGNPNDYSGNLNNGVSTNVAYTTSGHLGILHLEPLACQVERSVMYKYVSMPYIITYY